ncbi:MAG: hypothetical protein PHN75_12480 [Syntrophales bacterium]|nr:hypothetical protein [Syntrophales bacterium]
MSFESFGQQYPFGRRLRMEFIADPGVMDIVYLLELIDNALADVAKGSDIIREYLDLYWHMECPSFFQLVNNPGG